MANVFIEASTMTAIGDAIRAKTGGMALIYPEDMPAQIASITTGGSGDGSDLVRYVTFLDEDGTQLYRMPVLVGDDCKDPVDHGDIAAPEKEDTNTIDYVRTGWTAVSGGTADADILKNITEDKTVYVAYVANTRYYTVNFYDEDGTTLLNTVEATYGADLTDYVPVREGYDFVEWNPSVANITSEFDTVAVWVESAKDEWDYLAESIAKGTYKTDYAIGYTVPLTFSSGLTVNMVLAAFDHDDKADGSGKAAMTFVSEKTIWTNYLRKSDNDVSWWSLSLARKTCNGTLYDSMPTNVREQVKTVTKISQTGKNATGTTEDKIWFLSSTEVGFTSATASLIVNGQGAHYSQLFKDNNSRKKYKVDSTSGEVPWLLRSKFNDTNYTFVSRYGSYGSDSTIKSAGAENYSAAIGFCI